MKVKKLRIVKITSISIIVILICYLALHNMRMLSLLSDYNIKYNACVDETCFTFDDEWLVLYNSDSLYGSVIAKIYGIGYPSMRVIKLKGANIAESAVFSKVYKKIDRRKYKEYDDFNWGRATVLASESSLSGKEAVIIYLDDFEIFITATSKNIINDIVQIKGQ